MEKRLIESIKYPRSLFTQENGKDRSKLTAQQGAANGMQKESVIA